MAVWVLHEDSNSRVTALLYADPRYETPAGRTAGSFRLKTMSSRPRVMLRGVQMPQSMTSYAHGHYFYHNGCQYRWVWSYKTQDKTILYLKDQSDRLLARCRRKPGGFMGEEAPVFELFVPPQSIDMDMFIVTGMASASFWPKYGKDTMGLKIGASVFGHVAT